MSRRKPMAALAAVTAALAVAVPAASADAAVLPPFYLTAPSAVSPAAMTQTCQIMAFQGGLMSLFANPVYANAQAQLTTLNGCAGTTI